MLTIGNIVRLKSGGPKMTVDRAERTDVVECVWFNPIHDGKEWIERCRGTFSVCTVELVSDASQPPMPENKPPVYPAAPGARKIVDERWRLRNGSVAHITTRDGVCCAGTIDGSHGSIHIWINGVQSNNGYGYDMVHHLPGEAG
jgi:uncharacterized protein YodC (DUF2158 family)